MADARVLLKDQLFSAGKIATIAAELHNADGGFDAESFVADSVSRLPELELKQRIGWITDCLEKHLPADYRRAVQVLVDSLPAPCDPTLTDGDFGDFIYAPYAEYIARHGCTEADFSFSLAALRDLTTRFSAELALRPFVDAFPEETRRTLLEWTGDDHYHVRRLCSEGTRPRLPWAPRLTPPVDYAVPLLDRLYRDPTRYVTRSVANHVNDISKVDPDLAVDLLRRWQRSGHPPAGELDFLVRHATRTLAKRGDPAALALLGISTAAPLAVSDLTLPEEVELGSALVFSFTITALEKTEVLVDYVIRYPGAAEGRTSQRTYRIKRLALEAGQRTTLTRTHPLPTSLTTRTVRPGGHELEVRINGRAHASSRFRVTAPR